MSHLAPTLPRFNVWKDQSTPSHKILSVRVFDPSRKSCALVSAVLPGPVGFVVMAFPCLLIVPSRASCLFS